MIVPVPLPLSNSVPGTAEPGIMIVRGNPAAPETRPGPEEVATLAGGAGTGGGTEITGARIVGRESTRDGRTGAKTSGCGTDGGVRVGASIGAVSVGGGVTAADAAPPATTDARTKGNTMRAFQSIANNMGARGGDRQYAAARDLP